MRLVCACYINVAWFDIDLLSAAVWFGIAGLFVCLCVV